MFIQRQRIVIIHSNQQYCIILNDSKTYNTKIYSCSISYVHAYFGTEGPGSTPAQLSFCSFWWLPCLSPAQLSFCFNKQAHLKNVHYSYSYMYGSTLALALYK